MTPAETAKQEAAKQAVILVFAIAGVALMIPLYKRMGREFMQAQLSQADRLESQLSRMRGAQEAAKRWDRVSSWLFVFGPQRAFWWAHDRAEAARRAYDAERP